MATYQYQFQSDYLEFYLLERRAFDKIYFAWPQEAVENNIFILEGAIGIRTYPSMDVTANVTIEVCESAPTHNDNSWQRINECSLDVCSELLYLAYHGWECYDSNIITLAPNTYRVRIHYGDQSSLDEEFALSQDYVGGKEEYKIVLWPAPYDGLAVIQAPSAIKVSRPAPPIFCHRIAEDSSP